MLRRRVGGVCLGQEGLAWDGRVLLRTGGSYLGRGFCLGRGALLYGSLTALLRASADLRRGMLGSTVL